MLIVKVVARLAVAARRAGDGGLGCRSQGRRKGRRWYGRAHGVVPEMLGRPRCKGRCEIRIVLSTSTYGLVIQRRRGDRLADLAHNLLYLPHVRLDRCDVDVLATKLLDFGGQVGP